MVEDWRKWEDDRICCVLCSSHWLCVHETALSEFLMVLYQYSIIDCPLPNLATKNWSQFTDHLSDYFNFVNRSKANVSKP